MNSVLVTGGAGFLGSHLCDRLIEMGKNVICVDNFFTGNKRNIAHLIGHPRFEVIRHDIVHPLHVECDQIFNLACPASPPAYQFNPIKTIQPGQHTDFTVTAKCKNSGDVRFQAELKTKSLTKPVSAEESTRLVAERAQSKLLITRQRCYG